MQVSNGKPQESFFESKAQVQRREIDGSVYGEPNLTGIIASYISSN